MPVFISDIYRSCELQYQSTVNDFYSLPLRRYVLDNGDMESAANVPSQSDYYQFGVRGLENMSKVAGFPLFASKPHFLDGDISLIENIDGVTPERNLHETFVDYEINTGVAMRAAKRLQVNTLLEDWDLPTFVCGEPEIMKLLNLTALCGCLSVEVDGGRDISTTYVDQRELQLHRGRRQRCERFDCEYKGLCDRNGGGVGRGWGIRTFCVHSNDALLWAKGEGGSFELDHKVCYVIFKLRTTSTIVSLLVEEYEVRRASLKFNFARESSPSAE